MGAFVQSIISLVASSNLGVAGVGLIIILVIYLRATRQPSVDKIDPTNETAASTLNSLTGGVDKSKLIASVVTDTKRAEIIRAELEHQRAIETKKLSVKVGISILILIFIFLMIGYVLIRQSNSKEEKNDISPRIDSANSSIQPPIQPSAQPIEAIPSQQTKNETVGSGNYQLEIIVKNEKIARALESGLNIYVAGSKIKKENYEIEFPNDWDNSFPKIILGRDCLKPCSAQSECMLVLIAGGEERYEIKINGNPIEII